MANIPKRTNIGNEICDNTLDNSNCSYDGNDCRTEEILISKYPDCVHLGGLISGIGDGYCDDVYNTKKCGFDEGDCCLHESLLSKEFCHTCACFTPEEQIEPNCTLSDGFDASAYIGNKQCDDSLNRRGCYFDGGDCCLVAHFGICTDCYCLKGDLYFKIYVLQRQPIRTARC